MKTNWPQIHKIRSLLFSILFVFSFSSCDIAVEILEDLFSEDEYASNYGYYDYDDSNLPQGGCPARIAASAFEYAKKYAAADTQYKYGAQDPLRAIQIDCSGLVIRCYGYALQNTEYSLLKSDMSSSYMYQNASFHTTTPRHGDLIFMGEENSSSLQMVEPEARVFSQIFKGIISTIKMSSNSLNSVAILRRICSIYKDNFLFLLL